MIPENHIPKEDMLELASAMHQVWHRFARAPKTECSEFEGSHRQGLWVIGRLANGPLKMSEISEKAGISSASLTGIVDRLEQKGLVVRTTSPTDRRVTMVELTEQGRGVVGSFRTDLASRVEQMLVDFSDEERAELIRLLHKLHGA